MEVSVLSLRDLASGRPGRRGRAEAAQKVSGRRGRAGRFDLCVSSTAGSPHTLLRLSRCRASRRPGRSAKLQGGGRNCREFGHPAARGGVGLRYPGPVRAGRTESRAERLGGGTGWAVRPMLPISFPLPSAGDIWGAAFWTSTPDLPCRVGLYIVQIHVRLTRQLSKHRGVRRYYYETIQ